VATQEERRAQTRQALLDAGATLFADLGVAGASVDAIAKAAGRTSGALYDHFGSKEGLLFALLQSWVGDAAALIEAEQATATSLDEWVAAMWHAVSDPPSGDGRWIALEHELWSYAAQSEQAREYLARRYRGAWDGVDAHVVARTGRDPDAPRVGPAVIGLLLGLEMMRRIDPSAVTDDVAIAALEGVVAGTQTSPTTLTRST
jgi:AcrR family transcriptional regulator